METILVTGGAGFIGSHVCDALLSKGYKVVCLDNFNDYYSPERKRKNIADNTKNNQFILEEVDITDFKGLQQVFENHKPNKIVHLAARAGVRASLESPFIYEKTNILGTLNLLELSRHHNIKNFIFGSSSSVYGNSDKIPFSEDNQSNRPLSPYAATKKAGELMCHTYSYLHGLNITCLRFFTVYGPRGRPDMAPYLFTNLIYEGKQITMYGDGTAKRDYTYVGDIVTGVLSALNKEFRYEIINLGNSESIELKDLISTIEKYIGQKAIIQKKDMPKADVPITYADITKARKLLDYVPQINLDEGIRKFVYWYKTEIKHS